MDIEDKLKGGRSHINVVYHINHVWFLGYKLRLNCHFQVVKKTILNTNQIKNICTIGYKTRKLSIILDMARNAGQHGGFLCLSSALIQHSKWRIYIEYA